MLGDMTEIRRLHAELEQNPNSPHFDKELMVALKDFVKLSEMVAVGVKCDKKEHEILKYMAEHTDGLSYAQDPQRVTRLELIVYQVSHIHANSCLPRYPHVFDDMVANRAMRGNTERYVSTFVNELQPQLPDQSNQDYMEGLLVEYTNNSARPLKISRDAKVAAAYIRWQTFADNLSPFDRSQVATNYRNYLGVPCLRFVDHYGPDLVELFLFDAQMFPRPFEIYDLTNANMMPFILTLVRYKICKFINAKQGFVTQTIKEIKDLERKEGNLGPSTSGRHTWVARS